MLCLAFVSLTTSLFGQKYVNREWVEMAGIPDTVNLAASAFDDDKNLLVVGNTFVGPQNTDVLLTKYNSNGDVIWQQTAGGNYRDYGVAICTDQDNNVYVAAVKTYAISTTDYFILKYDENGTLLWSNEWNSPANLYDIPTCITVDTIGNVYVSGTSVSPTSQTDYATVKFNASGVLQWSSLYDYANLHDFATAISLLPSGDVLVTDGSASATNAWDFTTLKYAQNTGSQIAESRVNVPGIGLDKATAMVRDNTGNIFLIGYTEANGHRDIQTVKLSPTLGVLWVQTFDGEGLDDIGKAIGLDADGNAYVTGTTYKNIGGSDFILIKYDTGGNELWKNRIRARNDHTFADVSKISVTANGDSYLAGTVDVGTQTDMLTAMFNTDGRTQFVRQYDGSGSPDRSLDIQSDADGNVYVMGLAAMPEGTKYATIKYSYYDKPGTTVYAADSTPWYRSNQLIIKFNPAVVNTAFVDNKDLEFAELNEVVSAATITAMNNKLGIDCSRLMVMKVMKHKTTADSLLVTRNGDIIKSSKSWSTLLIEMPDNINLLTAETMLSDLASMIEYAERNLKFTTNGIPGDQHFDTQKSLFSDDPNFENGHINVISAWDIQVGQNYIKVGVIDEGIAWDHPEFGGNISFEASKIEGGYDYYHSATIGSADDSDLSAHGTNVAGIIGAYRNDDLEGSTDPLVKRGIAGIAGGDMEVFNPGVQLFSYNIFGDDAADLSDVSASINRAVEVDDVDIINASIGSNVVFGNGYETLYREVKTAWTKGCIFVSTRGNENSQAMQQPGCMNDSWVICVGANDVNGARKDLGTGNDALFGSNYGTPMDVLAPGQTEAIVTTTPLEFESFYPIDDIEDCEAFDEHRYQCFGRTSAAAPHVSGVAALLLSQHNTLNGYENNLAPEDVEYLLQRYAVGTSNSYDIYKAWGKIDAGATLQEIVLPCKVAHYSTVPSENNSQSISTNSLTFNTGFVTPIRGYHTSVERYKISQTLDFTIYESSTIKGAWTRGTNGLKTDETLMIQDVQDVTEELINVNGNHAQLTLSAMTYYIHSDEPGVPDIGWFPVTPENLVMKYSLHICDVSPSDIVASNLPFKLSPNPVHNLLTVSYEGVEIGSKHLAVIDALGRTVFEQTLPSEFSDSISIDTSHFSDGVYWVQLAGLSGTNTQKFVKY